MVSCADSISEAGKLENHPTVVFVCEHGAAKSIIAAAYFNQIATQMGWDLRAVARGTNPDDELSSQAVRGLAEDGVSPTESVPQKLTSADLQSSQRVVSFCDLPADDLQPIRIERWEDIPPVSENYAEARDRIIERIRQMKP